MAGIKLPKSVSDFNQPFAVAVSDEQKQQLERDIGARLLEMTQAASTRNENIRRYRAIYNGSDMTSVWGREVPFKGAANLHIPLARWILDALHVRIVQSHFGVTPFVRIKAQQASLTEDATALEEVLWYAAKRQKKFQASYPATLDSLIAGYGIVKLPWNERWQSINGKPTLRSAFLDAQYVPSEDFYVYPANSASVEMAEIVGHRFYRRFDSLANGAACGLYDPVWLEALFDRATRPPESETDTRHGVSPSGIAPRDLVFELFEMIVSYDYDDDGLEEDYLCVMDRATQKMIRFHRYPLLSGDRWFHVYTPFPDGTLYGYSLMGALEALDEEMSTLHNQRIDNNTLINFSAFLARASAFREFQYQDAIPAPFGRIYRVNEPDDIIQLTKQTPLPGIATEEDRVKTYAQLVSGVSDINAGQMAASGKTAYEIEAALSEGSIKLRLIIENGVEWLVSQAWQELAALKQFWTEKGEFERVTGMPNPLDRMDYPDLWKGFDIEPAGNTTTSNRELERQKWVYLYEILKGNPLVTPIDPQTGAVIADLTPFAHLHEVTKQLLLASGVTNWEQIIGKVPTAAPVAPATPVAPPVPTVTPLTLPSNGGTPPATPADAVEQALRAATGGGVPVNTGRVTGSLG